MRIMALDYGDARTGIAVSDAMGILAGDAWTVHEPNTLKVAEIIAEEVKTRGVEKLVVGYPRNMDGTAGARAEKCAAFGELLREKTGLEVIMWDERRTTVDAHRILSDNNRRGKKRKNTVDAVAATLILEGYLNSIS
ncbi:MAG: Holliday junction resolvase RuvX [Oscillospiraceae bacterium]|nr:Holliday junction resolvase RuvX [Oscillospiraceae bacterium]